MIPEFIGQQPCLFKRVALVVQRGEPQFACLGVVAQPGVEVAGMLKLPALGVDRGSLQQEPGVFESLGGGGAVVGLVEVDRHRIAGQAAIGQGLGRSVPIA